MKGSLLAISLILITAGTVTLYPSAHSSVQDPNDHPIEQHAKIEVVFAVDTTSSMSGLIATAKEKVWSIATMLAQSGQTPEIRMGLVAYRDRGDEYVTRVFDLTTDLDSMYQDLMSFVAAGGGDGPESVNAALDAAVNRISWSQNSATYRTIFLVGDAPPHMDYDGERHYRHIVADASARGIIVNTIQCGDLDDTIQPWTEIAKLGNGRYVKVEQDGGSIAVVTPFDRELAELAADLDESRLYFGTRKERLARSAKAETVGELLDSVSEQTKARRGIFNATVAGAASLFGEQDLVKEYAAGRVDLDTLSPDHLPESIAAMAPEAQEEELQRRLSARTDLRQRIDELAAARDEFLTSVIESEIENPDQSLDRQLYNVLRTQAEEFGISYADGPKY